MTATTAAPSSEGQGRTGEAIGGSGQILDAAALDTMTAAEIVAANRAGRLDTLKGITR